MKLSSERILLLNLFGRSFSATVSTIGSRSTRGGSAGGLCSGRKPSWQRDAQAAPTFLCKHVSHQPCRPIKQGVACAGAISQRLFSCSLALSTTLAWHAGGRTWLLYKRQRMGFDVKTHCCLFLLWLKICGAGLCDLQRAKTAQRGAKPHRNHPGGTRSESTVFGPKALKTERKPHHGCRTTGKPRSPEKQCGKPFQRQNVLKSTRSGDCPEMPGNARKCPEMPGKLGPCVKARNAPFWPFWSVFDMCPEMPGNARKCPEMPGGPGRAWERLSGSLGLPNLNTDW